MASNQEGSPTHSPTHGGWPSSFSNGDSRVDEISWEHLFEENTPRDNPQSPPAVNAAQLSEGPPQHASASATPEMEFSDLDHWVAESSEFLAIGQSFLQLEAPRANDDMSASTTHQDFFIDSDSDLSRFLDAHGPYSSLEESGVMVASTSSDITTLDTIYREERNSALDSFGRVSDWHELEWDDLADDVDWDNLEDPDLAITAVGPNLDTAVDVDASSALQGADMSTSWHGRHMYSHQSSAVDPISNLTGPTRGPQPSSLIPPPLFSRQGSWAPRTTGAPSSAPGFGPQYGRPRQRLSIAPLQGVVLNNPSPLHLGGVTGMSGVQRRCPLPVLQPFQIPLANNARQFTFTFPAPGVQPRFLLHNGAPPVAHSTTTSRNATAAGVERKREWRRDSSHRERENRQSRSRLRERRKAKREARACARARATAARDSLSSAAYPTSNANCVQGATSARLSNISAPVNNMEVSPTGTGTA